MSKERGRKKLVEEIRPGGEPVGPVFSMWYRNYREVN